MLRNDKLKIIILPPVQLQSDYLIAFNAAS